MAQNESNFPARIDELAKKTDGYLGQGSEDAAAQTSGLEAPQNVA